MREHSSAQTAVMSTGQRDILPHTSLVALVTSPALLSGATLSEDLGGDSASNAPSG